MKELTLDEIALLEEMKSNCLKKGQYIDDKAKDKFKILCHLEDFSIAYYELLDSIKEVREYIEENQEEHKYTDRGGFTYTEGHFLRDSDTLLEILDKENNKTNGVMPVEELEEYEPKNMAEQEYQDWFWE